MNRYALSFLNRQNTSILGTLGILNFRQLSEQPALLVKKYFTTKCIKINSKQLYIFFEQILHLSDFIRALGILGGNRSVFKAFENDIF